MVKLLGGGSSLETIVSDMNANLLEIKNREVIEIFKDDEGTRRVVIDKDGLRTSPTGVDVITAGEDELTFNSNRNTLKIVVEGTVTIPAFSVTSLGPSQYDMSSDVVTYTHNLGYKPVVLISELETGGSAKYAVPYTNVFMSANSAGGWSTVNYRVTDTELIVAAQLLVGSTPSFGMGLNFTGATYSFYLLQETA